MKNGTKNGPDTFPVFTPICCTVADITCRAYPIPENKSGLSWKDNSQDTVQKLCNLCGYDYDELSNVAIVSEVFYYFSLNSIKLAKGKTSRVEDMYSKLVEELLEIRAEVDCDEDVELAVKFLELVEKVGDSKMIGYLISALAHAGYSISIVPTSFFTTAVLNNYVIDSD